MDQEQQPHCSRNPPPGVSSAPPRLRSNLGPVRSENIPLRWYHLATWLHTFKLALGNDKISRTPVPHILGFRYTEKPEDYYAGIMFLVGSSKISQITVTPGTKRYVNAHIGFGMNYLIDGMLERHSRVRIYQEGGIIQFYQNTHSNQDAGSTDRLDKSIRRNIIPEHEKTYKTFYLVEDPIFFAPRKPVILGTSYFQKGIPARYLEFFNSACSSRWERYFFPENPFSEDFYGNWQENRFGFELVSTLADKKYHDSDVLIEFFLPQNTSYINTLSHLGSVFLSFFMEVQYAKSKLEAEFGKMNQQWIILYTPFRPERLVRNAFFSEKVDEFRKNKEIGMLLSRQTGTGFFPIDIYAQEHSSGLYSLPRNWASEHNILFIGETPTLECEKRILAELKSCVKIMKHTRDWTSPEIEILSPPSRK